ncbi:beta-1,4 N-acetylgalactosaminyltransferase 1-like isoform X2 [Denticeps clupeoides]|uniref:beta-1,4 N-acetylgalactosaminyltransferase 1-like isoform X2 n=1 Tax=Denticeps clupeoides TaxID=299321 RepID=UPI0010A4CDB8|nr:beta-1,4 N-acetylgalactosaminyltransferase 1-like isoform X2 [Denticeps clupeoides]
MLLEQYKTVWLLLLCSLCLSVFAVFMFGFYEKSENYMIPTIISRSATVVSTSISVPCNCSGGMTLKTFFNHDSNMIGRRKQEYVKHKTRTKSSLDLLLLAPANSPLQYPIQGFTVAPLKKTPIPGLGVYASSSHHYKVSLAVSRGVLTVENVTTGDIVKGQGKAQITIIASSEARLNILLQQVHYTSTVYRVRTGDLGHFVFEDHNATFPIVIQQPSVPILYDPGEDVNSQVTITVKTFLSFDPVKVNGTNIEHYIMPPAQGWFAGRTLAVSQVTTKYFLWVDDDFYFTENTKIEELIKVMESMPELDIVSAAVGKNSFSHRITYEEGDDGEGGCLQRYNGPLKEPIPGFPQCFLSNVVINFFLGRSDSVRKVSFDPQLKRAAHSQFFIDGLGDLLIASCSHVNVNHQKKIHRNEKYLTFRKQTEDTENRKLYFFKNHLKCINLKAG